MSPGSLAPRYSLSSAAILALIALFPFIVSRWAYALGSGSTVAVASETAVVCGIAAGQPARNIACRRPSARITSLLTVLPNISFSVISGGRSAVCGLTTSADIVLCWDTRSTNATLIPRRVYYNSSQPLQSLAVGDDQVCALLNESQAVKCWRTGHSFQVPPREVAFSSISSGFGFSCGILLDSSNVRCWGRNSIGSTIQNSFGNKSMSSLVVGGSHACGIDVTGFVVCRGSNDSGQLDVPAHSATEFSLLSLGANHTCAIRHSNGSVACWGGGGGYSIDQTRGISFGLLASGNNFTCGLIMSNFSVVCWGPGRPSFGSIGAPGLQLGILPGPCVQSICGCGIYPGSQILCGGLSYICVPCDGIMQPPGPPTESTEMAPPPTSSPSRALRKGLLAFAVVGSAGFLVGIVAVGYCIRHGVCSRQKKIHNSVQPTITRENSSALRTPSNGHPSRQLSATRRLSSRKTMRRQRSGTSSKQTEKAEEFTFEILAAATEDFSLKNKIGAGSYGVVYKGKLQDGREVAIKRGESGPTTRKFQEKESAFESELAFLSRLHHKHLVGLVGYCQDDDERLLVYEYMKNGALHDHLHSRDNVDKLSSPLNSWKIRIKIALDASRGIDYLHNYAVPPIIHRDIKSSNILLDTSWTARVSDFGLSLLGPDGENDLRPSKAAGTVGYIDPEYYGLNVLTAKSDVYGFGVVLLELLTGKRAIFRNASDRGMPISVVDYAVPDIMAGDIGRILDTRVGPPGPKETEAVELAAYIAMHCVSLEGKDRPTMADVVASLERAWLLCDGGYDNNNNEDQDNGSHGSISAGSIQLISD
ncbi:hypothetical protein MLD38_008691 [Melastoma candidum]|uniref:Uncharacterized protein n=1 Tax=Melastoma candidum TaxID=119954 RepID=A0ACB9RZG5_9MYRT|nr:hypothetical protein MLD38_008691 [Melastoma candidum]